MSVGRMIGIDWSILFAGVTGGAVSTLIMHPLDLAKVRLQVNEGTGVVSCRPATRSTAYTLLGVLKKRGLRGLYLGLTPNLIGATSSWGLYFLLYGAFKNHLQLSDPTVSLGTATYLYCSGLAGLLTISLTNPIWVAKTRLMLQYEGRLSPNAGQPTLVAPGSQSTWRVLLNLWQYEGVAGLYRGYLPAVLGVTQGAIQFMLYEEMKNFINRDYRGRPINAKLNPTEYILCSSTSKLVAVLFTYPYQVIRSRLQDQHRRYTSARHVIRELLRCEGAGGLYKGLFPNLVRVVPACTITFLVYEYTYDFLKNRTLFGAANRTP